MATLTAWKFDNPDSAEQAIAALQNTARAELIKVQDPAKLCR